MKRTNEQQQRSCASIKCLCVVHEFIVVVVIVSSRSRITQKVFKIVTENREKNEIS